MILMNNNLFCFAYSRVMDGLCTDQNVHECYVHSEPEFILEERCTFFFHVCQLAQK